MSKKSKTFLLFTKNRETQKLIEVYGPFFEDEIDTFIVERIGKGVEIEVLEEEIFSLLYKEEYILEKSIYWLEYLSYRLQSTKMLEVFTLNYEEDGLESNIFSTFIEDGELVLNFSYSIDPALAASITLDLVQYFNSIFEVKINPSFYISPIDSSIHKEEDALFRFIAEQRLSALSLN